MLQEICLVPKYNELMKLSYSVQDTQNENFRSILKGEGSHAYRDFNILNELLWRYVK